MDDGVFSGFRGEKFWEYPGHCTGVSKAGPAMDFGRTARFHANHLNVSPDAKTVMLRYFLTSDEGGVTVGNWRVSHDYYR